MNCVDTVSFYSAGLNSVRDLQTCILLFHNRYCCLHSGINIYYKSIYSSTLSYALNRYVNTIFLYWQDVKEKETTEDFRPSLKGAKRAPKRCVDTTLIPSAETTTDSFSTISVTKKQLYTSQRAKNAKRVIKCYECAKPRVSHISC